MDRMTLTFHSFPDRQGGPGASGGTASLNVPGVIINCQHVDFHLCISSPACQAVEGSVKVVTREPVIVNPVLYHPMRTACYMMILASQ